MFDYMKRFFVLILTLSSSLLFGGDSTTVFSRERLINFYDIFLLEEKDYLAEAGIGSPSGGLLGDSFTPPPNPPPPPFIDGYLPVVLVNTSGFPDNEVYVVVTGETLNSAGVSSGIQAWGQVNNLGEVSLVVAQTGQSSVTYSYALSALPSGSTGRVIYLPQIASGLVWVSIGSPLHMTVDGNSIVQPSPTNSSLPDYTTSFQNIELTYLAGGSPQISLDATAVSYFSVPMYVYLAGSTSGNSNCGLYQPRSYIMSQAAAAFGAAKESAQWDNLVLKSGSTVLRLLSPGQAISANLFDENYLDNSGSYGYSYLGNLLSYYSSTPLNMSVNVTVPSAATYTYAGQANGNVFTFTSNNGGPMVAFQAFADGPPYTNSTTYNILEGLNLVSLAPPPTAGTAADAVSKLFEEAIVAGILPTRNQLTLNSLVSNQANYYKVNPNLSSPGGTTGPWYDLYSQALHALGLIYTYAYDDALWPQVLLGGPFVNNSTYVGITIMDSTN